MARPLMIVSITGRATSFDWLAGLISGLSLLIFLYTLQGEIFPDFTMRILIKNFQGTSVVSQSIARIIESEGG